MASHVGSSAMLTKPGLAAQTRSTGPPIGISCASFFAISKGLILIARANLKGVLEAKSPFSMLCGRSTEIGGVSACGKVPERIASSRASDIRVSTWSLELMASLVIVGYNLTTFRIVQIA